MMAQTIPTYRLPREILAREVRMIERLGVDIQCNQELDKDFTLESLKEDGYEAVFLGVGAPDGLQLGLENEEAEGVSEAIRFLREYNIRGSVPVGNHVVIIGGGNAAINYNVRMKTGLFDRSNKFGKFLGRKIIERFSLRF